jgi:hypothetical protein
MGSLAEFPDLVRATIINPELNNRGIYNIRFFIRGKPWVITIDDNLLFHKADPVSLVFAKQSKDNNAIWAALLEKAWAKMRGNYLMAEDGMAANGIRALTGVPVFDYYAIDFSITSAKRDEMWDLLVEADSKSYIMAAGTLAAGDVTLNECGLRADYAYSLIAVFTMTDANGDEHRCLLMRDPIGKNGYFYRWSKEDPKWTQELIDQVPHGFDPLAQDTSQVGLFVVPFHAFEDDAEFSYCLDSV